MALRILGALITACLLLASARAQEAMHPWVVVQCDSRRGEGCFLTRDGLATDSDRGDMRHITLYNSDDECALALSKRTGIKQQRDGRWVWLSGKRAGGGTWQVWFECRRFSLQTTP